ncbi:uncharacterized protein LOC125194313 isoform X4 [Salvia hispanica]|uniref:uncharacterized protein LOC125194313 isoform X4 n=1 Tax=Salvia hispanica TaxID=49212 RepID=UPI00200942BA|nr:uncharacterized protein LOC125194313 isoform X4 [Salvia hispanica]
MIEARRQQLSSMFYLRGLCGCAKDLHVLVVLLCAAFLLASCDKCSLNEAERQIEIDRCKTYTSNSHTSSLGIFDGDFSLLASRNAVEQQSLDNICPDPNSFCFLSTLSGSSFDEVAIEKDATDEAYNVQSEGFLPGLKQERSNLSWPAKHGIFKTFAGRVILCSLNEPDDFHGSQSEDSTNNGQNVDVSSCMSTLFDHGTHTSKSGENAEGVNSVIWDSVSRPPVEVRPFLLDWGQKNLYYPSVAFITVKNVHSDSVLTIHYPYSSNSQFYPCNFSEIFLAPGDIGSICFTFFPRNLGLSSAQIVLQTSFGGFVIQAKGFAVDSPYFIKPLDGFNISSNGRWRKNLSLFNPYVEALYVEEITAWISISSGNNSRLSKAVCSARSMEGSSEQGILRPKEWLEVGSADSRLPEISVRPHKNWEVPSQLTEAIMELEISDHFEGKIVGAFCLQLVKSSASEIETVVVPFEAEFMLSPALDTDYISVSLEALVPSDTSAPVVALSVRNDGPHVLSVIKVRQVGDSADTFQVKFVEGLVLFPKSVTQVAVISYRAIHEVDMTCNLLVEINDTRSSQIEISCIDVINVFAGQKLDSATIYAQEMTNVIGVKGRKKSFDNDVHPPTGLKAVDRRQADDLVLSNWKSQARASFMSVLDDDEVLFPMVEVGNHCSEWIAVKNPSNQPILVQLILNSGEVIDNCRTNEMHLQPSSSSIIVGNKSIAPTKYGFSIAKDGMTEALIHPYGSASFGPVLFQPSVRCEWRSSALIRNNLSGVEWLPLRGFGGSVSLVLLDGSDSVRSLEFKMNFPSQLNFSSPETLHPTEGKKSLCSHPLIKEVYAKNMGDFPLEVVRIGVSGSDCGLDGFLVLNCKGFTLPPGESVMLQILYQSDFSMATIQRDLELSLAAGILVIPMRASSPMLLINFCKRSTFWMRLKKIMVLIFFAASLLFLLVHLLIPRSTAFTYHNLKSGKKSSAGSGVVNYLSMRLKKKTNAAMPPNMNGYEGSIVGEEALLLGSAAGGLVGCASGEGHVNASEHQKHENSFTDDHPPENRLASSQLSNFSPVGNSDIQAESDSRSLTVRIGKEKGRRRRKKKTCGMRVPGFFEVSSSQSSNSTPTSPLSPATSLTPKRSWLVPLDINQPVEVRNPFSEPSDQQHDKREPSEPPKVNLLKNEASPGHVTNWCYSAGEKLDSTRKLAGRAILLPSATFPSAGRSSPSWECHSPFLASTSTISPQARAPGTKLNNHKISEPGAMIAVEEKFQYDIWGDHIFRLPVANQSNQASNVPFHPLENNSESFFVKGPQTLMTNSLLKPFTCKFSRFFSKMLPLLILWGEVLLEASKLQVG